MIYSDERVFMNTIIRLQVVSSKGTIYTRSKIEDAYQCFDTVVKKFSRFSKTSELTQLNNSAAKPFKASTELFTLLQLALKVAKISDYAYDPTIIDLLEAYGYDANQDYQRLNRSDIGIEVQKLAAKRPSCDGISLNVKEHTVTLKPNQRVDLGSVAKGYAIDLAYEVLAGNGFDGFLINAGGDLRAYGCNSKNLPWRVMLYRSQLPNQRYQQDVSLGSIVLENMAIAGSGGWARRDGSFHHLLNPKNGQPLNSIAHTFVMADNATEADVWATALFVMGVAGLEILQQQKLEGLVVTAEGEVLQTENLKYDI